MIIQVKILNLIWEAMKLKCLNFFLYLCFALWSSDTETLEEAEYSHFVIQVLSYYGNLVWNSGQSTVWNSEKQV